MGGPGGGSLKQAQAVRRAHGGGNRWLLSFLLFAIGVTAIVAVVVAAAMGQTTVAMIVGLVSAAFFAGMLC